MGRIRKDGNPLGLEQRVYWHHGQFWYRHRDGKAERLGTDLKKANARARVYNDPHKRYGTLGYFLDRYIADARAGRLLRQKKPRTISDNEKEAEYLKAAFDKMLPQELVERPDLIAKYRDRRTAKVRANRELSLLSAMYSWLIESGECPGLRQNPVLLIARNRETQKERYVEDAEFRAVYALAQRSVCMAMTMVYRTLQRPADVLEWRSQDVRVKTVAGTATDVITVTQNKTEHTVDIQITPDVDEAIKMLSPDGTLGRTVIVDGVTRIEPYLVHTLDGKPYTVDGIGAMLRRYCHKAGVKTFGLMDVRAKGATDMYLRGIPLERIQMLMGHESVQTTEIYIKRMLQTISVASPNPAKVA